MGEFLHIKYGSAIIEVPLDAGDITTIAHVKAFLEKHHANLEPDSIKLIAAGKVLENSTPISALRSSSSSSNANLTGKNKTQSQLTLMASNKQQLAALSAAAEVPRHRQVRVKDDLAWDEPDGASTARVNGCAKCEG